ncbi:SDR family NAD(P)-dependent oxidoreductase [bacterium]|nr:SDR family NAD(P)-dependent oxidoreductase [bacterium]
MKTILVTGSSGFIGFHLCKTLLKAGYRVVGYDAMTDYYDVSLKIDRRDILLKHASFVNIEDKIENLSRLNEISEQYSPNIVVHLAAQAGVRYSIDEPRSYVDANLIGTFNILELSRNYNIEHLLIASTSSVYGANTKMPFKETDQSDHQVSFYAATKRAAEAMSHSYSHLYGIPTTMFRFFTVYGEWGRPDMALFKFTKAIMNNDSIDIYNNGDMKRDFTYVADLVEAINRLILCKPDHKKTISNEFDSTSPVAPWRIVNIGNSEPVGLMAYIEALENSLGQIAVKNYMPMQAGDVAETFADTRLLYALTNFRPKTSVHEGVQHFVDWYRGYYK